MAKSFKVVTQTDFAAITLSEAKTQCRLLDSFTLDDAYIEGLIPDCADAAQEYLNWMVSPGTVTQFVASAGVVQLYGKFVTEITSITAFNSSGDTVTLTEDEYYYNPITEEIELSSSYYYFYINYSCGASTTELPGNVRRGIMMMISTAYNNREDFITGLTVEKMPLTSVTLLEKSRNYVS